MDGILSLLWSAWNHTATCFWPTAIPLNSCNIYCSLCSARNLVRLSEKSLKLLRPDAFINRKVCQICVCGRPGSRWGSLVSLQRPPVPLAGFKGPTSKARGGHGGSKRRGGERKGKGNGEGQGHTGTSFPHFEPCWKQCRSRRSAFIEWCRSVVISALASINTGTVYYLYGWLLKPSACAISHLGRLSLLSSVEFTLPDTMRNGNASYWRYTLQPTVIIIFQPGKLLISTHIRKITPRQWLW